MKHALPLLLLSLPLAFTEAHATYLTLDADAECRSISATDVSSCTCQGRYFDSKFGPEHGAAALHLVSRSYTPEPQVTLASLYERFGAEKLNKAAQKVLEARGEVAFYCPFSPSMSD